MTSSPFEVGLLFLLAILPVLDLAATVFFFRLFQRSEHESVPGAASRGWSSAILGGRSWLLGLLTASFAIITAAFMVIGYLAARRILGQPSMESSGTLVALVLLLLGAIPPAFMWAFWLSRRKRGRPPPFSEED